LALIVVKIGGVGVIYRCRGQVGHVVDACGSAGLHELLYGKALRSNICLARTRSSQAYMQAFATLQRCTDRRSTGPDQVYFYRLDPLAEYANNPLLRTAKYANRMASGQEFLDHGLSKHAGTSGDSNLHVFSLSARLDDAMLASPS